MLTPGDPYDVEDVEFLRHDSGPLLARLFKPKGPGPFPAMVELHGGAWSMFERTRDKTVHEALANAGVFVMAPDFRQGATGAYPLSIQDINYAVRWLKANAATYRVDPDRVGIAGNSTGGHLAMLTAMRPEDPRYTAISQPPESARVDASVRCVAMLWPVINPLGRYRHVKRLKASASAPPWCDHLIGAHDSYWKNEDSMSEGSPTLMLERGERVKLPPALWIQAREDDTHNYRDLESGFDGPESERFAKCYRQSGGRLNLVYFDAPMMFTTLHPTLPASVEAMRVLTNFVLEETA